MGELGGWERATWYDEPDSQPRSEYSHGQQNWFDACTAGGAAVRLGVTLFREEPIFADGQPVGLTTSGMSGHRVDASLGTGPVKRPFATTPDWLAATRFEIGVGERQVAARAQLAPWHDPGHLRMRG